MLDYPVLIRTMVAALAPALGRNSLRRADRTRTCNLRFWRPLRYQLRHYPMDQKPHPDKHPQICSGAHVIIRVFNTGEPVYATTSRTSNQPHSGPFALLELVI
jgi:hypothetical protein